MRRLLPYGFVRCGPGEGRTTSVTEPVLVVGVLSPSTGKSDLTKKRWAYQMIESAQANLLLGPDRPHVELSTREAEGWLSRHFVGLDTAVPLKHLDIELPLADLYGGADLAPPEAPAAAEA